MNRCLHVCTVATLLTSVLAGCTAPDPAEKWGPMAVMDVSWQDSFRGGSSAAARSGGTLHITEDCVYLGEGDTRIGLVWSEADARWDPTSSTIEMDGRILREGQAVELAGGARPLEGQGMPPIDFVNPPSPTCRDAQEWFVIEAVLDE